MTWITWLINNADINNVGFVIGLFGAVFSIYTYLKGRERRALLFKQNEIGIIGSNDATLSDRIEIKFDGLSIPRVTKSTFWVWNEGSKTIEGSSIARSDPLRFELPDGEKILEASMLSSGPAVDATMPSINDKGLVVAFDFLEPKQGFKVSIVHTAKPHEAVILGTVRGVGNPRDYKKTTLLYQALALIGAFAVLAVMLLVGVIVGGVVAYPFSEKGSVVQLVSFTIGAVTFLFGTLKFAEWQVKRADLKRIPLFTADD